MSETLGDRIRQIRQSRKQTMKEFGESFHPKASKGVVSNWENGYNRPNKDRLEKIASWGKYKSVNELLYGSFKDFTYNTLKKELEEKNVLYYKVRDYLQSQDKSLTQITDPDEKEEVLEIRADVFLKDRFGDIFKILNTEKLEKTFFTNKDEVIPIINRVANYYVDYRIYALEHKFNLNEFVYFRHIETRDLKLVSDTNNEIEYEINYHISINTSEPLKESARIDYELLCYPVLTLIIDSSDDVSLSSVRGLESLKEDKYKAIFGKDTFKKLEVELLKDALALSVFN